MEEKDEKELDQKEKKEKDNMEETQKKISEEIQKKLDKKDILNRELIKCMIEIIHLNGNKYIPNYKINEKIKNKLLKEMPFSQIPDSLKNKDEEQEKQNEDAETKIEYIKYRSGIKEIITKYVDTQKIKCKEIDFSELDQKYIDHLKNNPDEQLELLIENIALIYNFRSSIIKKIVKKPFSYKVLVEKLFLWNYYMDKLDNVGKAKIIDKWLNQLSIFSKKCYDEFMNIKQVKKMYLIFKEKNKINEDQDIFCKYNEYYGYDEIFGIDARGNYIEIDKEKSDIFIDSIKLYLFKSNIFDIKSELEGNGVSFIFLEELKNLAEMFWYSSILYLRIFYEGLVLFEDCFFQKYIRIQSIMISFFSDTFLEKHFIISLLTYIKFLFASYKELEILRYMQKICMARIQVFGATDDLKEAIDKLLKENDKLQNIDDLVKYIEGDEKPKKKKKKKKNKHNPLDALNIGIKNECDELLDDGISIMSEPDTIVESFKIEIINDTISNKGEKLKPYLSKNFLEYLDN